MHDLPCPAHCIFTAAPLFDHDLVWCTSLRHASFSSHVANPIQAAKGGDEEPAKHAGEAAADKAAAEEAAAEDSAQHDPLAASTGTRSRVGNRGKAATAEATSAAATEPKEATSPPARSTRTVAASAEKADDPSDGQKQAQAPATAKKHAAANSGGEKPAEAAAAEGAKPAAIELPAGREDAMPEAAEGEEVAAADLPADRIEAVPEAKHPAVPQPSTRGGASTRSSGVASSAPGQAAAAAPAAAKEQTSKQQAPGAAAAAANEQTSEQQAPAAAQPQLPSGSVKPDEAASPGHKSKAGSPVKKQRDAGEKQSPEAVPTDSSKPGGKGHEVGAQTKSAGQASSPVEEAPAAQQAAPAATPAKTVADRPASKEGAAPVGDVDMAEATQASSCPLRQTAPGCPSHWLLCMGPEAMCLLQTLWQQLSCVECCTRPTQLRSQGASAEQQHCWPALNCSRMGGRGSARPQAPAGLHVSEPAQYVCSRLQWRRPRRNWIWSWTMTVRC